jgi:hypothetical protein
MPRYFLIPVFFLALLWSSPAAAADVTIGGACTSSTAQSAQATLGGNNVVCVGGVWQYPAYQVGTSTATCNATNAGITRYNSGVEQYCNGSVWITFPGMVLISTQTASSSATLPWMGLGSTYYYYKLICTDLILSSTSALLYLQFGEGATPTWKTSNYVYGGYLSTASGSGTGPFNSNSASGILFSNGATETWGSNPESIELTMSNPASALYKYAQGRTG